MNKRRHVIIGCRWLTIIAALNRPIKGFGWLTRDLYFRNRPGNRRRKSTAGYYWFTGGP
jgi:hypothetical protein